MTALLNLSILEANKKRIMHADGAIEAVTHIMSSGTTWRAKENAATALLSLASVHTCRRAFRRGKVSPPRAHGPDEHKEGRAGRAAVAGRREGERREAGGSSCEKRATAACGVREQQEIGGANEIGSSKSMQPTLKGLLVVGILNLTPFCTSA